jgi:hypothetical protein
MLSRLRFVLGVGFAFALSVASARAECPNGNRHCREINNTEASCFNEPPPNLDLCKLEFSNDKCEKYVCLDKTYYVGDENDPKCRCAK